MSFEIQTTFVEVLAPWKTADDTRASRQGSSFVDQHGHRYAAFFDGERVTFRSDAGDFSGRWIQGTAATVVQSGGKLAAGFEFTFMDHGPRPQRLHATWRFSGSVESAVAAWRAADFFLSRADRRWNRNHPAAIHLRTRGRVATGADSSHVVIPLRQSGEVTHGDIHVGEFNPLTGLGVGFVLHHLEPWLSRRARD